MASIKASHPVRGAWIEIAKCAFIKSAMMSHPVRGAWIEIYYRFAVFVNA